MKKIIILSVVASSMIFATTVNNIDDDVINNINSSSTNSNTLIYQGTIDIDRYGGSSSDVTNLTVKEANSPSDTRVGNKITGSTIDFSTIGQGAVVIDNSKVNNLGLESYNLIENSTVNSNSLVHQGIFVSTDSNASDSVADDVNIESRNTIQSGSVGVASSVSNSRVSQSYTELKNGADVKNLKLNQVNTIVNSTIGGDSNVSQADTTIDNSIVDNLSTKFGTTIGHNFNVIGHSNIDTTSKVTQNYTKITNGSIVKNVENGGNINDISQLISSNSNITQNRLMVDNSSLDNFKQRKDNQVYGVTTTGSLISQSDVSITSSSDAKDITSDTKSTNKIYNSTINGSIVSQNDIAIDNATVDRLHSIQTNTIDATTANGTSDSNVTNSHIKQGKFLIASSSIAKNINQTVTNSMRDISISDSFISQEDIGITSNSSVEDVTFTDTNELTNTDINSGHVTQNRTNIY